MTRWVEFNLICIICVYILCPCGSWSYIRLVVFYAFICNDSSFKVCKAVLAGVTPWNETVPSAITPLSVKEAPDGFCSLHELINM